MNWIVKKPSGEEVEINDLSQFTEGVIGFVYKLTMSCGSIYIGKKNLYSERKKNFTMKQLDEALDKRKKTYTIVKKESNWKTYNGSNKQLQLDLSGGRTTIVRREILATAHLAKELTFKELEHMIKNNVLKSNVKSYNDNILGKFFRKDLNEKW